MTFSSTPTVPDTDTTLSAGPTSVADLGLTNGSPWPDFDDLTAVATRLLDADESLIVIIDESNRRHYPVSRHRASQTSSAPMEHDRASFMHSAATQVVAQDQPMSVSDLVSYLGVPLRGCAGEPIGVIWVFEEQRRTWTDDDLAQLQRLARAANNALRLRAAKLSDQARQDEHLDFAASLVEDLKVPMHSAHLLANDLETELPATVRSGQLQDAIDLAARISESLEGLGAGLDKHLEVLENQAASVDEEVDLEDVIDEVLQDLEPQLSRPTVTTRLGPLPSVSGDAAQLKVLFKNLLADSIRRHRDLVPLHISVTTAPCPATEHIRIRVTDNGRTDPTSTREELLGFLVRLDQPNQWRESSTNVDLCTSAQIVANHLGHLSFTSGPEVRTAIVDLRAWRS